MAAIYSNGGNRWNILGFNFTKRDALSSLYKISMVAIGTLGMLGGIIIVVIVVDTLYLKAKREGDLCV
jgi:hypothetical protein